MTLLRHIIAAMLIVVPAIAVAQDDEKIGVKQKMWMSANFRGLTCSATPGGTAVSFSGRASFDASGDGGVDLVLSSVSGAHAVINAVAINPKATGADKNRSATQSCPIAGTNLANGAAVCSVWGDPHEASVRFTVPVSALGMPGKSRELTGHVTLIKRSADLASRAWLSRKGYDHYKARSDMASAAAFMNPDMTVIATCDSSGLSSAKGSQPVGSGYDLAVIKKI
ncbi:MAG: hypothetical protein NVS3B5_12380 [Sphingomicrobium sp.]